MGKTPLPLISPPEPNDDVGLLDSLDWTEEESLERLKRFYVDGRLSLEEFEWSVGQVLRNRRQRARGRVA